MKKYIIDNVEYTLEQVESAARNNGVDIDTYINDMGVQVVDADQIDPDPVEKPTAPAETTAAVGATNENMGLQLENGSLGLPNEVSIEEKKGLPFGVRQHLYRKNKKFTPENIQQAYIDIEEQGNKTFDDYVTDLKDEIVGNGVERFKNWSYNVFGPDGIGGLPGPSTLSRFQQASAAYALALDKIKGTEESEKEAKKEFKKLSEVQKMQKQMPSVTDEDSEGLLGVLAGILGDTTQVAQSVIPTIGAGFAGGVAGGAVAGPAGAAVGATTGAIASTALQIAPSFITDYNLTKAEEKYKNENLEGDAALEKLIEEDEAEMLVPLTGAAIAMIPEYVGFKGISKYLLNSTAGKSVLSKVARLGVTSGREGLTEVIQLFPEGVNNALAAGEDVDDAVVEGLQYTFENTKNTFLSSAVGTAAFGLGGKAAKSGGARAWRKARNMRVAIDEGKMESVMDEISELNVQRMEANEPELKEALTVKINDKVKELDALDTRANSIMSFASDQDFNEITRIEDLKKQYIKKVKNIQNKKEQLDPKEYQQSLEIYKEKYLEAQARIKGVANKVKTEAENATPEQVSERTVKNANEINAAYKKDSSDKTFFDVVLPNMQDLLTSITNRKFRENPEFGEQGLQKEDFINDLTYGTERNQASSLYGLYKSFSPDQDQFLTTYITKNLENRAKRIVDERLGKQATVGGVSIDTEQAQEIEAEKVDMPAVKGPKFTKRLGLSDEIMNKARNAAIKALSTAKEVDSKTFTTDIVNSINNEIFDDIRKIIPKPKEREAFMEKFAGAIWDAIPSSSLAKATRNQTFQSWNLNAPTKKAFVDYFLGRDQEGLAANTINDRARKQLPEYLAKAIGAEYAADLLQNDADIRERFALTQEQEVEDAAAEIELLATEEVTQVSEKDLNLKIGNDFLTSIFKNYKDSEFVNNLKNKAHLLRQTINKVKVLDKQKADNIAKASVSIAKSFPSELHKLFKNGFTEIVGFHYRYLDPAKSIKKEKIVLDENGEQIKLSPGEAGSYYSSLQDVLSNQKSLDKLLEDGDISKALYNKFKSIDFGKIQIQNIQTGLKKGDFLFDLKKILAKDITAKEKQAEVLKIYDPKIFENNKKLAEAIVLSMQDLYNAGKINETQLASILQYQTDIAAGFRGLTGFLGVELKDGPQQLSPLKGEHLKPNAITMNEVFDVVINNSSVEGMFNNHDQVFGDKKAIMDPSDKALGRTSGVEGKLRITKTVPKEISKSVFVPGENTNLYDLTVKEWIKTFKDTPDVAGAKVDVEIEKRTDRIETLINRAIGKLEDYLGPKGSLQANFAAVPINILVGGLRATKLAYRGSKNLTEALQEGYKKVKDYMSQREWLDFTKKAVSEVKTDKNGKTVALAIANENAIKNEQVRKTKLDILKKAGVYSKEDDNKTSQELNEKLKEKDEAIKSSNRTEGLERNFRKILNTKKDTSGRPSKWFIPPNAEDIKGLLYAFLPKGKAGVEAKKFFNSAILKPYSDGIAAAEAEILQKAKLFKQLKEDSGVDLNQNIEGTPYTLGDAIKVYNWDKQGVEVDILKDEYLDQLIGAVELNPEAKYMAEQIANNYEIAYDKNWRNIPFNKSIFDAINSGTRGKNLEIFSQNIDAIFNKDNLKEIENVFGKKYVQALSNTLKRMKTGRNRISTDAQSNAYMNFINRSVATTMFFNTRSAGLQLLSALNYIGQDNNNIFQATAAFANQAQWQQDYNKLWNSDYLTNRRKGAKFDVLADEIAEGDPKGLNKLLKAGFLPTRYADSFAIALGGAAFYRNRVNALMKKGMPQQEAEEQGMKDWIKTSEESQQSSDPSKISEIQASGVGKIIYAFANTPFQYARIVKRKLQDITSGRSYAEGGMNQVRKDIQTSLYYTAGQALLFNALQSGLVAALMGGNDDEEKLEEKTVLALERALTSFAKSTGNPGAIIASIYSMIEEADSQIEKKGRIDNPYKIALEATGISPPVNAKLNDIVAIGNIYKYNHKQIEKDPFELSINNPTLEIAGNAASFAGVPLDRVIRKTQNLNAAMNEELDAWTRLWLVAGWSKWELGVDDEKSGPKSKAKSKAKPKPKPKAKAKPKPKPRSAVKKLKKGIAGEANRDGTIEIDPNLSPVERAKTIAHEEQHVKDMKSGMLDYDKNYVYWKGGKYKRESGKIIYKGKSYVEGDPKLPWEKRAYSAEPSTKEIKRKKLYA